MKTCLNLSALHLFLKFIIIQIQIFLYKKGISLHLILGFKNKTIIHLKIAKVVGDYIEEKTNQLEERDFVLVCVDFL